MPIGETRRLPFDITDCRRYFRRYLAQQARLRRAQMRRARQARTPIPPRAVVPMAGHDPLSATDAMQWLHLSATPFYLWRQLLDIHPIVKKNHQALYARTDLLRLHAAYLAHTRTKEAPHDG